MGSTDKIKRLLDDHQAILPVTGVLFVANCSSRPRPTKLEILLVEVDPNHILSQYCLGVRTQWKVATLGLRAFFSPFAAALKCCRSLTKRVSCGWVRGVELPVLNPQRTGY